MARAAGEDLPEDWCQNSQSRVCAYPAPFLTVAEHQAFTLFGLCGTQWRAGFGGAIGLDYNAVELVADIYDFDLRDPEFFARLQVIESEYLKIMAEDAEKKGK